MGELVQMWYRIPGSSVLPQGIAASPIAASLAMFAKRGPFLVIVGNAGKKKLHNRDMSVTRLAERANQKPSASKRPIVVKTPAKPPVLD